MLQVAAAAAATATTIGAASAVATGVTGDSTTVGAASAAATSVDAASAAPSQVAAAAEVDAPAAVAAASEVAAAAAAAAAAAEEPLATVGNVNADPAWKDYQAGQSQFPREGWVLSQSPVGTRWCPTCSGQGYINKGYYVDSVEHWSHTLRLRGVDDSAVGDWATLYCHSEFRKSLALEMLHKLLKRLGGGERFNNVSALVMNSVKDSWHKNP